MKLIGQRAVIAGGSLAGMLAARVVAPFFEEVVVLERDVFGETPAPRRLTPQSHHVHMLLKGGERAITRLVPGFIEEIEAQGSVRMQSGEDFLGGSELGYAPRQTSDMVLHGQSRWLLEHCLRQCVLRSTSNIQLRTNTTVKGLLYDDAGARVTGVELEGGSLPADVVIDATGRGEAGLRWLSALGLPLPEVEEVGVDFGYASVMVELDPTQVRDWKALAIGNLPRVGARGAVLLPIEGDRYLCSLGGRAGDYPPEEKGALLQFAESLPKPLIFESLKRSKFLSSIARMIYPANRFRHYERMEALPEGLIPLGDALCSFNPTYGQGMSSAALQALSLHETLQERNSGGSLRETVRAYLQRAAEVARMPWRQANYNDFLYPTTQGDRNMFSEEEMRYRMQIQIAATKDEMVRRLANEVGHLLLPFERLMEADVRQRVDAALAPPAA